MRIAIRQKATGEVAATYEADAPQQGRYGGP
jgi:hypothetical protein